jgi:hypothetical protein
MSRTSLIIFRINIGNRNQKTPTINPELLNKRGGFVYWLESILHSFINIPAIHATVLLYQNKFQMLNTCSIKLTLSNQYIILCRGCQTFRPSFFLSSSSHSGRHYIIVGTTMNITIHFLYSNPGYVEVYWV